jgi:YidC/Oxa1 family membrane protein insertase
MERRAVIAVIISILILILYQEVVLKRFYGPGHGTTPEAGAPPAAPPEAPPAAPGEAPSSAPVAPVPAPEPPAAAPAAGADVAVDTHLYHAVFTTGGARLKSLQLKRFRTTVDPDSPALQMIQYPVESKLPLGLALVGAQQLSDASVSYRADRQQIDIPSDGTAAITFTGELAGSSIRKRVEMRGDVYEWTLDV